MVVEDPYGPIQVFVQSPTQLIVRQHESNTILAGRNDASLFFRETQETVVCSKIKLSEC